MKCHYLVTGGAGFIGTHLVQRLADTGNTVTVIDDYSTGSRGRLTSLANPEIVRIHESDIRNDHCLREAIEGVDGVFHLAAKLSVQDSIKDWLGHHSVNSTAMLGLFDLVRRTRRMPIVYASSAAVYGNPGEEMCREDMVARPISPYGADKLSCESHASAFWSVHGIPSVGLRLFNVYGPGQPPNSSYAGVLTRFVADIKKGMAPEIHGDGLQTRDFVYISNVVDALVAGMDRVLGKPDALVCNVCTGTSHKVRDIAQMIAGALNSGPIRLVYGPARVGDIRHSCGASDYMAKTLGLGSFIPLEQGIARWLGQTAEASKAS